MVKAFEHWIQVDTEHQQLKRTLNEKLKAYDLTLNELYVLYYLLVAPKKQLPLKELAAKVDLSFSALSRLIMHMSTKECGVIQRVPNVHDKRSTYIKLTSEGEKLLERALKTTDELLEIEYF